MYLKYTHPDEKLEVFKSVEEEDLDNLHFYFADGADVDMRNDFTGLTLLHKAVVDGKYESVKLLLDYGADPNLRGGPSGYSALHFAAYRPNAKIAALLLENGAELDASAGGETPLHLAAHFGSLEVSTLLAEKGADLEAVNQRGFTPREAALAQIDEYFDFEHARFREVARYLEEKALGPKIEQIQRDKVEKDISELKRRNPNRFKLKM